MSQHDNKHKSHDKADQQKAEDAQKHIENTGKKVNKERSKHNTDQQVKEKVTGANQGAPPY